MSKPLVSIIIPIHNGKEDTLLCLKSLSALSYPKSKLEIVIVDNASTDGSVNEILKTQKSKKLTIKIIKNRTNRGFAQAVNQAIKKSLGELIFVINNDIVFNKDFISILVEYIKKNPKVGIVGGKIYYSKPKNKLLYQGLKFNPWTGSLNKQKDPNILKKTEWVQGCAMLIDKKVVRKIGFLDPGFFFSFEDADYCLRARRVGFDIIYNPKAVGWHKESASIDRFGLVRKAEELYKAKWRYILKNSTLPQIFVSSFIQFLIIAPVRKLVIKQPPFFVRPMFSGFFYNIKQLPSIIKLRA